MSRTAAVVIVGGGVIGSAIASFLAADPAFDGEVIVVERDPSYRDASSARSAGSIRQQFSTPENIRMSRYGFAFLRDLERHLAVDGDPPGTPDVALVERGYLFLVPDQGVGVAREIHAIQRAEGADVALLGPDELGRRYPWMSLDGIAAGSLGRSGEGWFDGFRLLGAFRRHATAHGATFVAAEVEGLTVRDDRAVGVTLADGISIAAGHVVIAAGPWSARVAAMAGVDLPVEARRRTTFAFEAHEVPLDGPLVVDPSGAWFRPDGPGFIGAIPPPPEDDRPDLPLEVDEASWMTLWAALARRVPGFDAIRRTGAWAGYYEMNTVDQNAILGPHPAIAGLLLATGFSGHGIQGAPAVGRAIAECIVHARYVTLDLDVFGLERFAAGRRVVERGVIG